MCVALPGVVKLIKDDKYAVVDFHGNEVEAAYGLVNIKPGDSVLVHAGCVIQVVSKSEAQEMEELFAELADI
ncbi:MAG: HypC/HybG/HupF family hydrogenase formation chaperone [Lachnospiraceae bacterium]|nr:HypC/HybG/HupF family hydrogenase formation chaperone [Lachnospiraceae bacterium]